MGLADRIRSALLMGAAALEVSSPATAYATDPVAQSVVVRPRKRDRWSRRTTPIPTNQTRWLQADVETAARQASAGDLTSASQLCRAFQRDGSLQGLIGTRTGGLVRLPKRFHGTPAAVEALQGCAGDQSGLFAAVFPQTELEAIDTDGLTLGVGVGEFVSCEDGRVPWRLVRLDPEFLIYRWAEDAWYYRTTNGLERVVPGDGRWVLHTPRGRYEPWNRGLWQALARAYVSKEHAFLYRENYAGKLANPARVAVSPQGAGESQKQSWFRQVMAWGVNSVFGVTPGYDVKLLESNGRGFEVFQAIIETCDREFMVAICGQIVTVTGGAGFANANIHATIRSDLIQGDGNALAATLNEQAIPHVLHDLVGEGAHATVAWDTTPPADMSAGAQSLVAAAEAINAVTTALRAHGLEPDVAAIASRFALPVQGDANGDAVVDAPLALPESTTDAQADETVDASTPSAAARLAASMTEHGVARCEHGRSNRCQICGVQRARELVASPDGGEPTWRVLWEPIGASS